MTEITMGCIQDADELNQLIIEFNLAKVPFPKNPPWILLTYVIKEREEIVAGIYGNLIMDNVLSVDVLYVKETIRHQGYGSQLLMTLEQKAKEQGAYLSQLDTFDFQGLDFYIKNGYEIFGELADSPARGHRRYYLKKYL